MKLFEIKNKITGTNVKDYFDSKFKLWCKFHAPSSEKDEISAYMKMLSENGKKFENKFLKENHPSFKEISIETTEEVFKELNKNIDVFSNLAIFHENFLGKPDLLVKQKGVSSLGDYYYIVKEIKSAKNIKRSHIMQAAFYNYLIGKMQGLTPKKFFLINGENKEKSYHFEDYEINLTEALIEIQEIKKNKEIKPALGTGYPWSNYAEKRALKERDITIIQGISEKSRDKFVSIGYDTIDKINHLSEEELLEIQGVGPGIVRKIKNSAKALVENKPIFLNKPSFKKVEVEIFFDLESAQPDQQLGIKETYNYLFGLLVRKEKESFIHFIAENFNEEEKTFRKFLQFIDQFDDFVIYVYSNFEFQQLKRMCEMYKIEDNIRKKLFDNMVDLLKIVKSSVVLPTTSNGLKQIAKYLGYKWRHNDVSGQESMAMYLQFIETKNREILKKIIDYNEDDVIATKIIKDWLNDQ